MAIGEKEQECFNYIRSELLSSKVDELTYEEFNKNRILYVKRPMKSFFAMTEQEICCVEDLFFQAKPNSVLSSFPDFISPNGFIEHFRITSSKTNRDGSAYKKAFSIYDQEIKMEVDKMNNEERDVSLLGKVQKVEKAFSFSQKHSHENLIISLKKCVEKHIDSLKKYQGSKENKIFLIEYDELSLMGQITYPNIKQDRVYGDFFPQENAFEYRLSYDKEALTYLYEKRDYINYIIFITDFYFEIIKVEEIPEILKLLFFDCEFHQLHLTTLSYVSSIEIPN